MPFLLTIREKFKTLRVIPQYFRAIAKEWMNILFGESLVGVAFLIWWALGNPPLVLIFILAALVAGYYAWRPFYLLRLPQLRVTQFAITPTPTTLSNVFEVYVHIIPECATDASVYECKGFLLRAFRQLATGEWETTALDEPLELVWSVYDDTAPRTLSPGIPTRLNVCHVSSHDKQLYPAVQRLPLRCVGALKASDPLKHEDTFKLDVRFIAKDCPPLDVSVIVKTGGLFDWSKPIVKLQNSN